MDSGGYIFESNLLQGFLMPAWTFTQAKTSFTENKVFFGGRQFLCQCYTEQFHKNIFKRNIHKIPGAGGGEMQKP